MAAATAPTNGMRTLNSMLAPLARVLAIGTPDSHEHKGASGAHVLRGNLVAVVLNGLFFPGAGGCSKPASC